MRLTAVYEHWHLADGNYPAFRVGDEARLSFEIVADRLESVAHDTSLRFEQRRDAEYEIIADILRVYTDSGGSQFPVLESGWFRFYVPCGAPANLAVGDRVRVSGTLALDHYLWVEFLHQWADPPDLFYPCRVARIRQVPILERFITRSEKSVASPTSLAPRDYASVEPVEVDRVAGGVAGPAFSLLDLDLLPPGGGPDRPTFIGA